MSQPRGGTTYCPPAWQLGLLAVACALALAFAVTMAPPPTTPGPFWASKPIILAVLLCTPAARWAAFLAVGLVVNFSMVVAMGLPGLVSVALINTAEIAVSAALLRRMGDMRPDLANPAAFRRFLLVAVLALPAVAALPAALQLSLRDGTPYLYTLQIRFLTDAIGMLVMGPATLSVLRGDLARLARGPNSATHAALFASVIGVAICVFSQARYPLLFLIPPPLILLAARTGEPGVALCMPIVTAIALYGTSNGSGPFWLKAVLEPSERTLLELAFLGGCVGVGRLSAALAAGQASALEKLREANDRLELATSGGGLGIWEWNVQSGQLTWDARMAELYGTGPGTNPVDLEGWAQRLHPLDRDAILHKLSTAVKGAGGFDTEFRILCDGGEVRHIRAAGLVRRDEAGKPAFMIGMNWDVTAYSDALSALYESEERLRLLIGGVRDHAVYLLDPEGRIASWNPGAERITGYSAEDIVGQFQDLLFTPDAVAAGDPAREMAVAVELGRWEGEVWRVRKDGSHYVARVVLTAQRDLDGTLRGFTKIAHDLSGRKMQEAQRAIIIEAAPAGMLIVDDDNVITLANSRAESLFGYSRGGLTGLAVEKLVPVSGRAESMRMLQAYMRSSGEGLSPFRQFDARRRDGSIVAVEVLLNNVRTPHGNITVATVLDASERVRRKEERMRAEAAKRAETAASQARLEQLARHLARARDEAQEASEAKSRFLASITHELRTPLNGILGYAQLLQMEGGLSPHQETHVAAMLGAGEHLSGMINAVLDLSQIESDRLQLVPVVVDLPDLASSCLDLVRPAAQAKSIDLRLDVPDGTPVRLTADKTRLRQVLVNLVGNAVKFTEAGHVSLRILHGKPRHVRLEVADTGAGIPAAEAERLFQEFSRLPGEVVAAVEGSGLGLAISARLVQRMGGSIGYGENVGGGSVFWIELPAAAASALTDAPAVHSQTGFSARHLHVLVVDDVETNRVIAAAMLRHVGHVVTLANNGTAAVTLAAAQDFDVILMDVRMAGIDGLEATRQIRSLPAPRGQVPVVALTAQAFASQIERCYAAGMDDHVSKPLEHTALLAALARVTADRRRDVGEVTVPPASEVPATEMPAVEIPMPATEECVFDETQFVATRDLLPPASFVKYLRGIAAQCEALQERLARPDALSDMAGLVEDVHKAGGNAGGMGMMRLASAAKQFEHAVEMALPDIDVRLADLNDALAVSTLKLLALAGSMEVSA
jgi:PAS domain S-box-containing protein